MIQNFSKYIQYDLYQKDVKCCMDYITGQTAPEQKEAQKKKVFFAVVRMAALFEMSFQALAQLRGVTSPNLSPFQSLMVIAKSVTVFTIFHDIFMISKKCIRARK